MAELKRRRLLTGGAAALAAGAALTQSGSAQSATPQGGFGTEVEPFHGAHQAGVATAPQAHALFVALDLKPGGGRKQLAAVLRLWSADAARLTQGVPALADTEPELALRPARLTVTVGLGPTVFDRAGLGHRLPDTVYEMPAFGTDRLESHWCGGDLLLQLCADDPMALAHAARVLLKNVRSLVVPRWRQSGFRHAAGADRSGATMRNLMGQVDGTANLRTAAEFDRHVWDDGAGQPWFAGGTVLVLRRIRAEMDTWDELDRESKEFAVGRRLGSGAPLTGQRESDEPDLTAQVGGIPVIPPNAHIALARHRTADELMLRRPYNYDDPPPAGVTTDSGLLFAAYQRDPGTSFVPVQRRLAAADALNTWVTTIGSATFAILPGAPPGEYLGQSLLG
ncbi:dyp-type peroxidase family protein [Mycolicibacterium canariasense]|uniref:Dyp-type peroxidase family protein n=1 Tax=Mycolicibacterium canariasense TaxID=228230 RepID=A0A117I8N9_MYCCR|nr:Dyp-type peroxidase [Mycolicibacterium canariasense]MCV7211999.1 Dyp-type peroxidase [Mycolicibacterium canariasense]ORV04095.1 peroxidase [Mycolicibacterium canariasense]GAS93485.1 dyp-type peroxidase family protein [Mycolicibacterium canariasense]